MRSSLLLLLLAGAAQADVQGKVTGEALSNAVVYADDLPMQTAPEGAKARLKQQHLKFVPTVLPILQGTTVEFVNADEVAHNVFSPAHEQFDLGTFGEGTRAHLFKEPGAHVILCNVHVEMVAWILVLKNPAFTALDPSGAFKLKLPPGKHKLVLWRPRLPDVSRDIEVPESGTVDLEWSAP